MTQYSFAKILLVLMLLCIAPSGVIHAEPQYIFSGNDGLNCVPADIVFVVDESGQMSWIDPDNMRIEAIKWFINVLGFDVLLHCPETTYRVALIGFNDASDINLLQRLTLTPVNPGVISENPWSDWEVEFQGLAENIYVNNTGLRNYEVMKGALEHAIRILKDAPPIGAGQRKQTIVLIMGGNGMWCTEHGNCAHYQIDREKKLLHGLLDQQLGGEISLSVVTLGNGYEVYDPKGFWENTTSENGGDLYAERKGVAIGQALMDVYQHLSPKPDVVQACGGLYVDPFTEKLGFNILLDPTVSKDVVFQDPDGITYTHDDVISNGSGTSILPSTRVPEDAQLLYMINNDFIDKSIYYLFAFPDPGKWEFDADCNNNKALVVTQIVRSSRVVIIEPVVGLPQYSSESQLFDPQKPYHLKFQIVDQGGHPLRGHPDYPANIIANIFDPQGAAQPLTFEYESGVFTSNEPLPVNKTGDYKIEIEFNVSGADPNFQDQSVPTIRYEGDYNVSSRVPFRLVVTYPTSSDSVPLHVGIRSLKNFRSFRPVEAIVRLELDASMRSPGMDPTLIDAILVDKNRAIKALLYDSSNDVTEEIWLQSSPVDPFLFTGTFSNEKFTSRGVYSLRISLEETQYNIEEYLYLPDEQVERVEFNRQDGILDTPYLGYGLIPLFLLAILAFMGWLIFSFTDPAQGYLLFYPPGRKAKPFVLLDVANSGQSGSPWTSTLLKLIPAKLRWVHFDDSRLQEESVFLKNLSSIEIYNPRFRGKSQKIRIVEASNNQPLEWEVEKDAQDVKIGTTSAHYEIYYSAQPPQNKKE